MRRRVDRVHQRVVVRTLVFMTIHLAVLFAIPELFMLFGCRKLGEMATVTRGWSAGAGIAGAEH